MTIGQDSPAAAPGMAGRGKAIAALVFGVLSFFAGFVFIGIIAAIAAVILGFLALREISTAQALSDGDTAVTKEFSRSRLFVYLGYIAAVLGVAVFLFMVWVTSLYGEGLTLCSQEHGNDQQAAGQCAQEYVIDRVF